MTIHIIFHFESPPFPPVLSPAFFCHRSYLTVVSFLQLLIPRVEFRLGRSRRVDRAEDLCNAQRRHSLHLTKMFSIRDHICHLLHVIDINKWSALCINKLARESSAQSWLSSLLLLFSFSRVFCRRELSKVHTYVFTPSITWICL